ncbi:hypothetical protein CRUP_017833, partial [Coryphaenoides rupestris]
TRAAVPPVRRLRGLPGGHGARGEPGDHQAHRRRHRGEDSSPEELKSICWFKDEQRVRRQLQHLGFCV